mgnify:CR=1 FL=1
METRSHFHAELDALKGRVSHLAALVRQASQNAAAAYFDQDRKTAGAVTDGERTVNDQACDIDEACLRLLALEQPVALDLRRIVGYSRAVINLERLGDEAVTIAEGVLAGAGLPGPSNAALRTLAEHVLRMCTASVAAFDADDVPQAMAVCRLDEMAQELAEAAMRHITDELTRCLASPEATVGAILAARSFERMGAHAANIAETVVFVVKGTALSKQCQP